jgi:hypothetical protein
MKIRAVEKEKIFIPEWNDNQNQPIDEQIRVNLKGFPSAGDKTKYMTLSFGDKGTNVAYAERSILRAFVKSIENLEYNDKVVMTSDDLLNSDYIGFTPLVSEIRDYIMKEQEPIPEGESEASK